VSVDLIAIAEEVGRGGVVREGVHDLLGRPGDGGMLGDVEVEDAPAIEGEQGHNQLVSYIFNTSASGAVWYNGDDFRGLATARHQSRTLAPVASFG